MMVIENGRSLKLRSIPIRFRFRYRSFYRLPKIVKLIIYTFYINGNVSTFFCSQLQLFSHAKVKVHWKQLKKTSLRLHSTFNKPSKIIKLILCAPYTNIYNAMLLFGPNTISESCSQPRQFQSCWNFLLYRDSASVFKLS